MYSEKRVGPRIEPCGTPIETARGQQAVRFHTPDSIKDVVDEPGKTVIWETKAIESANKNVVIDRVESLCQVDDDYCTVLSFIDGVDDIV